MQSHAVGAANGTAATKIRGHRDSATVMRYPAMNEALLFENGSCQTEQRFSCSAVACGGLCAPARTVDTELAHALVCYIELIRAASAICTPLLAARGSSTLELRSDVMQRHLDYIR